MALSEEVRDSFFDLCLSRKQPEKIKPFQEVRTAQPKAQKGGRGIMWQGFQVVLRGRAGEVGRVRSRARTGGGSIGGGLWTVYQGRLGPHPLPRGPLSHL